MVVLSPQPTGQKMKEGPFTSANITPPCPVGHYNKVFKQFGRAEGGVSHGTAGNGTSRKIYDDSQMQATRVTQEVADIQY
jgi:hypothetical protein